MVVGSVLGHAAAQGRHVQRPDRDGGKFARFPRRLQDPPLPDPADVYFEWTTSPVDGKKDPWPMHLPKHRGFSFAGLWAHNDNLGVTSCTIITAPAVEHIAHIHSRMPAILEESAYDAWLSGEAKRKEAKAILIDNHLDRQLKFFRVGREVNHSRYEGTDTKKPILNAL